MMLQDRLRLLRGQASYQAFAARVGRPFNSVRRYELGLTRIPADYVEVVCRVCGVSADWLFFGVEASTEAVLRSGKLAESDRNARSGNGNQAGKPADGRSAGKLGDDSRPGKRYVMIDGEKVCLVCVPVLTRIPAGPPVEMLDPMPVGCGLEGAVWVPDPRDPNAYGLVASGDSMEPEIRDGDTIVVSPSRAPALMSGLAVVRLPEDEVCVKHVRRRPGRLEVISINPAYPRMAFPPEKAEVIGKVIYILRDDALPGDRLPLARCARA